MAAVGFRVPNIQDMVVGRPSEKNIREAQRLQSILATDRFPEARGSRPPTPEFSPGSPSEKNVKEMQIIFKRIVQQQNP